MGLTNIVDLFFGECNKYRKIDIYRLEIENLIFRDRSRLECLSQVFEHNGRGHRTRHILNKSFEAACKLNADR